MQLAAVIKARTLAFIELDELNRHGRLRLADVVPLLVARYDFKTYPNKIEDFDVNDKGVIFGSGRWGDIVIDELKVYSGLIYAETLSSTGDSKKFLLDLFEWGAKELSLTYEEGMIRQWAYVSQVTFFTDFSLLEAISSPLSNLARKTGEQVSEFFETITPYYPLSFAVGHDPTTRKNGIANFSIHQRANIKFNENKYFSESPLPTHLHLRFLQELEEEVKAIKK